MFICPHDSWWFDEIECIVPLEYRHLVIEELISRFGATIKDPPRSYFDGSDPNRLWCFPFWDVPQTAKYDEMDAAFDEIEELFLEVASHYVGGTPRSKLIVN